MQRDNNDFSITTGRDGSRTFGEYYVPPRGRGNRRKNYAKGSTWSPQRRGRGSPNPSHHGNRSSALDQEGDVQMGGEDFVRFIPYSARPGSRHGKRSNQHNHSRKSSSQHEFEATAWRRFGVPGKMWFRVNIPYARKVEKAALMELLRSFAPVNFHPLQFHYSGEMAIFFLNDKDVAQSLKNYNRSLTLPETTIKLVMTVRPSSPPMPVMNEENEQMLTVALSARYDPSTKILDLSSLHNDQPLQGQGLFLPFTRNFVGDTIAKIIKENIPGLVGLNLSRNRMQNLIPLGLIVRKAPNVTSLDLSHNRVSRLDMLDIIKPWKLVELSLDGNPLCDKFASQAEYVCAMRKRFPKIMKLDGRELPPPITFDVNTSVLPDTKGSYFINSEVQDLVIRFLKEYYTIYDSDNRQTLAEAYHENAFFSLTAALNRLEFKQTYLGEYSNESRNMLKCRGDEHATARMMDKLLKKGREQVVTALGALPKTTHDANSFVVDVNLVSGTLLSFVVSGLFKESDNKADKPPIYSFSRSFVVVPASGGVLISNDMMSITIATTEQQLSAFKSTGPTPSSSPVSSNPPTLTSPTPSSSSTTTSPAAAVASPQQQLESLPPERQQMVVAFSQQSSMNYIFSFRCLEDNNWDFEKAGQIFMNLQAEGKIPPEAFVQ